MSPRTDRWLRCHRPRPSAALTLVCFPHAGGSASAYRAWPDLLGPGVEVHAVQYPGREDRLTEPLVDRMDTTVDRVTTEIAPLTARPYALFGHSMGGAVAYETALRLRDLGFAQPEHLFVSGRQPPEHHRQGDLHTRGEQAMAEEIVRLNPDSAALLEDRELAAIVLPAMGNDYKLIETYAPRRAAPLDCPITALVGDKDTELTTAQARDWAHRTRGEGCTVELPGDHFYLVEHRVAVTGIVADALGRPIR
ncbi:alpha/beta fold hydrolase [Nocardiopsis exhalans]|uniref:Alpha/beta fold hydrolase n=1 Tax=Nocardiopsis exhalans TaxID=163604 RepID=A0ABY5DGZ6_9ACTN|nr:alpha/beta fold hydrolase [Nocardiopsis exhalans]USY22318.1 alpha/beta fold hydrolase [Nocardiopsis exhalans]